MANMHLREYLFYKNIKPKDCAAHLGISRNHLYQAMHHPEKCGKALAFLIQDWTNGEVSAAEIRPDLKWKKRPKPRKRRKLQVESGLQEAKEKLQ